MKNKTIAFLLVVSLLALPAAASAATEFSLGGYIKLHVFWDSAAIDKNILRPPLRNDDRDGQHGRFNATSQSSRFNFTIKGPDLWGAVTTGYLEMDFDVLGDQRQSASHNYTPRLRHAFFRMNWPETEVLMGQYWSYFCEFYPEMIQDGPFMGHGQATHRLPQVRVTQMFGLGPGKMTLSGLLGKPTDTNDSGDVNYPISNAPLEGQTSETPQLQAKVHWEGDLWGKAGFYGRPRGFAAQVVGGWQRSRYRQGQVNFLTGTVNQINRNNWAVQGTLFIPVIPTATENLAGTSALTVQGYVGEGLDFIGNATPTGLGNSFINRIGAFTLERLLMQTWGGYVQANYYFSNQWFVNAAAGLGANFGVSGDDAFVNNSRTGLVHNWWEADLNLYYRPITAFKFGLGYAYTRARYFRGGDVFFDGTTFEARGARVGEAHRVQFAGWFFF
jgi:hypothetical protein